MKTNRLGICFGVLLFATVYFVRDFGREVFRLQDILSTLPSSPLWEVAPLSSTQEQNVSKKLQQKFYYLASGEQCHAFLGEDKETVLKFFRHDNPEDVLSSCKLAYESLPELSGILYLHINKTDHLHGKVKLLDSSWVEHEIDLDKTEFLVQKYGELIFSRFNRLMKDGDEAGAISSINIFLEAAQKWAHEGFHVRDPVIKRNIGYFGDQLLLLDTGSISKMDRLPTPETVQEEIKHVSSRLRRWLYKYYPTLYSHFQEKLQLTGYDESLIIQSSGGIAKR